MNNEKWKMKNGKCRYTSDIAARPQVRGAMLSQFEDSVCAYPDTAQFAPSADNSRKRALLDGFRDKHDH